MKYREHHLNIHPSQYRAAENQTKTFELRKNDRDFEVGDTLVLHWFDPSPDRFSNALAANEYEKLESDQIEARKQDRIYEPLKREVTHILHGGQFGLPEGLCIMSVEPVI